ncbi:MAG: hypothetical protein JWQ90_4824 [Hydrocarboniphaga sp.]|nr:hypothetical protein [Hydrocarboniphaga sp.]MDB5972374.1 hypothetical protein [Hydrocarboniphaga sp.]
MRHIADANLLLPVLTEGHAHRGPAIEWWEGCADGTVALGDPIGATAALLIGAVLDELEGAISSAPSLRCARRAEWRPPCSSSGCDSDPANAC